MTWQTDGPGCPGNAPGAVMLHGSNSLKDDRYYCGGKSLLTHFVMKHHQYKAGPRKKKNPLRGSFFFYAPSAQHAFGTPSQLDRLCAPPDIPLSTGPTCPGDAPCAVEPHGMDMKDGRYDDRYYCVGKAGLTPFLMEHLVKSGNQKKKTQFVGLFFLTGLRPLLTSLWPVLPLGQCSPSKTAALHPKCLHKSAPSPR